MITRNLNTTTLKVYVHIRSRSLCECLYLTYHPFPANFAWIRLASTHSLLASNLNVRMTQCFASQFSPLICNSTHSGLYKVYGVKPSTLPILFYSIPHHHLLVLVLFVKEHWLGLHFETRHDHVDFHLKESAIWIRYWILITNPFNWLNFTLLLVLERNLTLILQLNASIPMATATKSNRSVFIPEQYL